MHRVFYIGNDKWAEQLINLFEKAKTVIEIVGVLAPEDSQVLRKYCLKNKIKLIQKNNANQAANDIKRLKPELIIVVGHPFLLNKAVLSICPAIGFHPSMLPKRRGRAPLNWAIIDGLRKSGVSTFLIDKGIDSGKIIFQREFEIGAKETVSDLIVKVNGILKKMLIDIVKQFPDLKLTKQDESKASYTPKRSAGDSEITLDMSAQKIDRLVRSLSGPYPSAFIKNRYGEKIYLNKVSLNDE